MNSKTLVFMLKAQIYIWHTCHGISLITSSSTFATVQYVCKFMMDYPHLAGIALSFNSSAWNGGCHQSSRHFDYPIEETTDSQSGHFALIIGLVLCSMSQPENNWSYTEINIQSSSLVRRCAHALMRQGNRVCFAAY